MDKPSLRQSLRDRRNELSDIEQQTAARKLTEHLQRELTEQNIETVALYWAADGEISTYPFAQWCWQQGIDVYLPKLDPHNPGYLHFIQWGALSEFKDNQFGIPEPISGRLIKLQELDLICMPLVGFDNFGNRLGMGGGFYDRTLAGEGSSDKPLRFGLAHELQCIDQLPTEPWDIAMQRVVTDQRVLICK